MSPYANAVLLLSALHHVTSACYCYGRYSAIGQTAFLMGCLGSSTFAVLGLWCLLFADDKTKTSKYHHFDKHTSGFPFTNQESYRAKKKGL